MNMSNNKNKQIMKSQKAVNAENRILKAQNIRQAKEILELKEKLWNTSNERNELKESNKKENEMENLKNLLGQNAEMVISENGVVRVCIMGDQETQHNNNQVLRALGSSTNELKRMLKASNIKCLELMHDDGTLHLTISEESAQRLELEITDNL